MLCPADLEPEKLVATAIFGAQIFAVDGSYDDCSRLTVELSFELDWAFVNVQLRSYYAEGSKTLGFEIAEQLGWTLPDAVIAPIASGSMFTKVHQAFAELRDLGLVDAEQPRLIGGQAEGCSPVATAFADDAKLKPVRPNTIARSLAIGSPADGELAVATARASRGAVYAVAEDEIADNVALLAETTGVFGETAPGVTLGALQEAVRRGELGESDRVVLLVTGDGLKTPGLVADRLDADVRRARRRPHPGIPRSSDRRCSMKTGPRTGFRWTPETIVYAITLWYRKHSRTPFTSEWDQAGENHPSRQTVARVFGSWNAAMEAAGFAAAPARPPAADVPGGSVCRIAAARIVLLPGDGIGPEVAARGAPRARAARARRRARRAADRRRGDPRDRLAAARRDARRVSRRPSRC